MFGRLAGSKAPLLQKEAKCEGAGFSCSVPCVSSRQLVSESVERLSSYALLPLLQKDVQGEAAGFAALCSQAAAVFPVCQIGSL